MNAAELAEALGGRKTSRGYKTPCPSHPDKHPSLNIEEHDGKVLLICRAGCSQREVIAALTDRGLWKASSAPSSRPPFRWMDRVPAEAPSIPTCCLDLNTTCAHWRTFNADLLIARLHGNLTDAKAELIEKLERAGQPVTAHALRDGIEFAIPFGAIVPESVSSAIVARMVDLVLEGWA